MTPGVEPLADEDEGQAEQETERTGVGQDQDDADGNKGNHGAQEAESPAAVAIERGFFHRLRLTGLLEIGHGRQC